MNPKKCERRKKAIPILFTKVNVTKFITEFFSHGFCKMALFKISGNYLGVIFKYLNADADVYDSADAKMLMVRFPRSLYLWIHMCVTNSAIL